MADTGLPITVVTADQRRHAWFAAELARDPRLRLTGVVREAKRPRRRGDTEERDRLIVEHLAARDDAEHRYFGDAPDLAELGVPVLDVSWGASNDPSTAEWVGRLGADRLVLFGCSIVREPLLRDFDHRAVNLHLGLSPYYRGTASNFWPLVNGEPECVGATIHLATLTVDGGPIIRQTRPPIAVDDGSHDIGCKALVAGTAAMREAIVAHAEERAELAPQPDGGRVYKSSDFHPGAVEEMRHRFAGGMLPEYLAHKPERDRAFPIVE
jgi:folate-dependent phosphoribosylglycinamide formyltransferase PurN